MQGQLAQVVVAPLARLAAGHLAAGRDVVPAVRPVVDGVQQQALVRRVLADVRRAEERAGDREARLEQEPPVLRLARAARAAARGAAGPARRSAPPRRPPARGRSTGRPAGRGGRASGRGRAPRCPSTGCRPWASTARSAPRSPAPPPACSPRPRPAPRGARARRPRTVSRNSSSSAKPSSTQAWPRVHVVNGE